jgi:hypothetical protein
MTQLPKKGDLPHEFGERDEKVRVPGNSIETLGSLANMGHPSIRGRDRAHGPDPDRGLGRDHVRGLDLFYGPNDDHAQLDRGPRPNNP